MGICFSFYENRKNRIIRDIETLNKSLEHLKVLETKEEKDLNNLLHSKEQLCQQITQEHNKLEHIKNKNGNLIKNMKLLECKICMEKVVNIMLIPCGHCFCLNCSNTFTHCPICRSLVESKANIYFN